MQSMEPAHWLSSSLTELRVPMLQMSTLEREKLLNGLRCCFEEMARLAPERFKPRSTCIRPFIDGTRSYTMVKAYSTFEWAPWLYWALFHFGLLMVFIFHYLVGYIARGEWNTYSGKSWEFRERYVPIELRLAAYFWIKFRLAYESTSVRKRKASSTEGYVYSRQRIRKNGEPYIKYEPRFTPPGEHHRLLLHSYDTRDEAEIVLQVAKFYYGMAEGIYYKDGIGICHFPAINQPLQGREKGAWVQAQAVRVCRATMEAVVANELEVEALIEGLFSSPQQVQDPMYFQPLENNNRCEFVSCNLQAASSSPSTLNAPSLITAVVIAHEEPQELGADETFTSTQTCSGIRTAVNAPLRLGSESLQHTFQSQQEPQMHFEHVAMGPVGAMPPSSSDYSPTDDAGPMPSYPVQSSNSTSFMLYEGDDDHLTTSTDSSSIKETSKIFEAVTSPLENTRYLAEGINSPESLSVWEERKFELLLKASDLQQERTALCRDEIALLREDIALLREDISLLVKERDKELKLQIEIARHGEQSLQTFSGLDVHPPSE